MGVLKVNRTEVKAGIDNDVVSSFTNPVGYVYMDGKDIYDNNGAVKAIDILNDKPLTRDYFKSRPDMKQRVRKSNKYSNLLGCLPKRY